MSTQWTPDRPAPWCLDCGEYLVVKAGDSCPTCQAAAEPATAGKGQA